MHLFHYHAEQDARSALTNLRDELSLGIKFPSSFQKASTACEMLCIIANAPDHFLGVELINILDHDSNHSAETISTMILAFLHNIQSRIEYERKQKLKERHAVLVE